MPTPIAADEPINPTGRAHPWSDDVLAALLALSRGQVAAADTLWRQHAPPAFRGLLAGVGFTWDADAQLYARANGRPVDPEDAMHALLAFLAAIRWDLEREADQMARGEVSIQHWRDTVAPLIRSTYIAPFALGVGGTAAIDDAGRATIRATLTDSLTRLERFAGLVEQRDHAVGTVDAAATRGGLYASPGYPLFEVGRATGHLAADFTHERNVLEPGAEHCSDCDAMTELGWAAIGTLIPIGGRECGPACRCRLEYRRDEDH